MFAPSMTVGCFVRYVCLVDTSSSSACASCLPRPWRVGRVLRTLYFASSVLVFSSAWALCFASFCFAASVGRVLRRLYFVLSMLVFSRAWALCFAIRSVLPPQYGCGECFVRYFVSRFYASFAGQGSYCIFASWMLVCNVECFVRVFCLVNASFACQVLRARYFAL